MEVDICRLAGGGESSNDPLDVEALDCWAGTMREMMARAWWRRVPSQLIAFQEVVPEAVIGVVADGGFIWIFRRRVCRGKTKR